MRFRFSTSVRFYSVRLTIGALFGAVMAMSVEPRSPLRLVMLGAIAAGALSGFEYYRFRTSVEEDRRTRMIRASLIPLAWGLVAAALTALRLSSS